MPYAYRVTSMYQYHRQHYTFQAFEQFGALYFSRVLDIANRIDDASQAEAAATQVITGMEVHIRPDHTDLQA